MRFLILAHPEDGLAIGVAARLLGRHPRGATKLVAVDELLYAPHWSHAIDGAGARSVVTLHDGCAIDADDIGVVFNRLHGTGMRGFAPGDREYAGAEMFALMVSWLTALPCRVVNPASPRGIGGEPHTPLAWEMMAARAGLPVASRGMTSDGRRYAELGAIPPLDPRATVEGPAWRGEPLNDGPVVSAHVVGDRLLGELPPELAGPCLELSRATGLPVLRIDFSPDAQGRPTFRGADPFPWSPTVEMADAVADYLEELS
jgi:hypothetical protein